MNKPKLSFYQKHKVATAFLVCFLTAFTSLYLLKIIGVPIVNEAVLNSGFFRFIDERKWLLVIYFCVLNLIGAYCLCFAMNDKPYSKVWWHYLVIVVPTILVTLGRIYLMPISQMDIVYDIILYIILPIFFAFFINKNNHNIKNKVILLLFTLILYFYFIGTTWWSAILNGYIYCENAPPAISSTFLIFLEVYIGLGLLVAAMNYFIKYKNEELINYGS